MKYSKSNPPLVCMLTQSSCYKRTSTMEIQGILVHSTGVNNTTLKRYVQPSDDASNKEEMLELIGKNIYKNDLNHVEDDIGLNAWVGTLADDSVATIQTLPWNYRPWGCGSGSKGSCNDGWIQFEICEDNLTNKTYFEKVYEEACELMAYLCKIYNINPHGTVLFNGIKVPTILCHKDSYDLGLGSGHGDVLHWFPKYNKDMDTMRNDIAALLEEKPTESLPVTPTPTPTTNEIYRIRKSWDNIASQIGAYTSLERAKEACDDAGTGYYVFNSAGIAIYPEGEELPAPSTEEFKVGNIITLTADAEYSNGLKIPDWIKTYKLYVRKILANGDIVFSTQKTGAVTGIVPVKFVRKSNNSGAQAGFSSYLARVNTAVLNVRAGAGTNYRIVGQLSKGAVYTIIEEKGNWGYLKSKLGWICLDYIEKV